MKLRTLFATTLLALCATAAAAQTVAVANKSTTLQWEAPAPDAPAALTLTYRAYIDAVPTVLSGVTCAPPAGAPPAVVCAAPFPATTPGAHVLNGITASNDDGESDLSAPPTLPFRTAVNPLPVKNVKIKTK